MSGPCGYDVRPETALMKISLTSKIVASYVCGTKATAPFVSKKRLAVNDSAWGMAA